MWSIRDAIELEGKKIPTVTLITNQFKTLADQTVVEDGLPELRYVSLPDKTDMATHEEIRQITADYFDEIAGKLMH